MNFEPHERKVHYYHDQKGATFGVSKPRPFANTLCKMNSNVPDSHITTDPLKVTCKICCKDHRFRTVLAAARLGTNSHYGKFAKPEPLRLPVLPKRTRHRLNWRGKLILQVEEMVPYNYDPQHDVQPGGYSGRWRDATIEDLDCGVV